jgi:hypothetical protein
MTAVLFTWTIYDHPKDYPDHFVARKWSIGTKPGEPEATDEVIVRPTLDEVRALLPPALYCVARNEGDDPVVVETWL